MLTIIWRFAEAALAIIGAGTVMFFALLLPLIHFADRCNREPLH